MKFFKWELLAYAALVVVATRELIIEASVGDLRREQQQANKERNQIDNICSANSRTVTARYMKAGEQNEIVMKANNEDVYYGFGLHSKEQIKSLGKAFCVSGDVPQRLRSEELIHSTNMDHQSYDCTGRQGQKAGAGNGTDQPFWLREDDSKTLEYTTTFDEARRQAVIYCLG